MDSFSKHLNNQSLNNQSLNISQQQQSKFIKTENYQISTHKK
jgi:hypothetical protein